MFGHLLLGGFALEDRLAASHIRNFLGRLDLVRYGHRDLVDIFHRILYQFLLCRVLLIQGLT